MREDPILQQEAEETVKESLKSIEPLLSNLQKINFPTFSIPEMPTLEDYVHPEVTREQNAWERHTEMLEIQSAVLQVQKEILSDQKRNKKFMIAGLIFSGLAAIFGAIAIVPVLPVLGAWAGQLFDVLKSLLFATH